MSEREIIDERLEHHNLNIRVFITQTQCGTSETMNFGKGDWYSIYGYLHEYLSVANEQGRIEARRESEPISLEGDSDGQPS